MKINLQNYEEYFVRFIDNDLSKEEVAEVQLFLQQHGELKAELEAFKSTILVPDSLVVFPGKNLLRKGITTANYEEYFSRNVEHDLSPAEKNELAGFLNRHPELHHEMDVYKRTIFVADEKIIFPDKESLKKREGRVVPLGARYILVAAVAASLMLLFFMKGIDWNRSGNVPAVAQNESDKPASNSGASLNQSMASSDSVTANPGEEISNHSSSIASSNGVQQKQKLNKQQPFQEPAPESAPVLASNMEPLNVTPLNGISYRRHQSKAPYLVPVYEDGKQSPAVASNGSSSGGGWLSIASVVGSELLKLSGRGDLVKQPAAVDSSQHKPKEALALSFESKKFSFYHKFIPRKKSSTKNNGSK